MSRIIPLDVQFSNSPFALECVASGRESALIVDTSARAGAKPIRLSNRIGAMEIQFAEVEQFRAQSGATDLQGISALTAYLKQQNLFASSRFYPMKSAQNAGTGSTVFGIGGLTANNGTLVGSPTWGAGGIAYNGTNQAMTIPDFIDGGTLTVWARIAQNTATPASVQAIVSQFETVGDQRSWNLQQRGDIAGQPYDIIKNATGIGPENYTERTATGLGSTANRTIVGQWESNQPNRIWFNNTSISTTTVQGTSTTRLNVSVLISFASLAQGTAGFAALTGTALMFLNGPTPTATQREAITNLINAL